MWKCNIELHGSGSRKKEMENGECTSQFFFFLNVGTEVPKSKETRFRDNICSPFLAPSFSHVTATVIATVC